MHPDTIIASQFWKSVRSWHESAWWYGDLPEPENWSHGRRWREDDECWPWQGPRGRNGYGILNWLGKAFPAHRVAYVDHRIPAARGGADTHDNLWTLCYDCNAGKASRIVPNLPPLR